MVKANSKKRMTFKEKYGSIPITKSKKYVPITTKLERISEKIQRNWKYTKTGTILSREESTMYINTRKRAANISAIMKDLMPYVPMTALDILKRNRGFVEGVPKELEDIKRKLERGRGHSTDKVKLVNNLNKDVVTGRNAKVVFIPHSASKHIYNKTFVSLLLSKGIEIERIKEWSKRPGYIENVVKMIEFEGKLVEILEKENKEK